MEREILLIDDDPVLNILNTRLLTITYPQASIRSFRNGKEALDYLTANQSQPYTVLLDLHMPIMDGWTFLQEINKVCLKNEIDIFVVSSSIDPRDQKRALKHPLVRAYIPKPLTVQHLESIKLHTPST